MLFWDWSSVNNLISQRIDKLKPERRNQAHSSSLHEIEGKLWHFLSEIKGGVYFIGIHVMIRMPLEPEHEPVQQLILWCIPWAYLGDWFGLVILSIDEPIVFNILDALHNKQHNIGQYWKVKCLIDAASLFQSSGHQDHVVEHSAANVECEYLLAVMVVELVTRE